MISEEIKEFVVNNSLTDIRIHNSYLFFDIICNFLNTLTLNFPVIDGNCIMHSDFAREVFFVICFCICF
jgi:hypothetical protein